MLEADVLEEEVTKEHRQRIRDRLNDPLSVSEEIYFVRMQIKQVRKMIDEVDLAKVQATYDKALALKIAEIGDSKTANIKGKVYKGIPSNSIEKIARGIIADEEGYNKEYTEGLYKVLQFKLRALESELSSLQTIIKYTEDIPGKRG